MNLRGDVLRTRYGQVNGEFNHLVTRIGAEIDVLERPLATSAATAANGAAHIVVPAYGLTTVRLTLKKRLSLPKAFPNLTAAGEGVRKPGRSDE